MSLDVPALPKPVRPFISVDAQPMQELAGKETVARDSFGTLAEYNICTFEAAEAVRRSNASFEGFLSSLRSCGWRG